MRELTINQCERVAGGKDQTTEIIVKEDYPVTVAAAGLTCGALGTLVGAIAGTLMKPTMLGTGLGAIAGGLVGGVVLPVGTYQTGRVLLNIYRRFGLDI